MTAPPVCLIDASIYIFRYYFSLPERWHTADGQPTETVYGYTGFLLQLLERVRPSAVAACFDESLGSGFRHRLSPDYKASRVLPDESLAFQLAACAEVTRLLGIATHASDEYEADDLIGSLYQQCLADAAPVAVLTRDKDLGQLLARDCDYLWDYSADERHYPADITRRFGVAPHQLVDYLALVGDTADDIPGVPGVGPKTASALLDAMGSLEAVWAEPERLAALPVRGARGLYAKLDAHRDQIELSRQLARIVMDAPLEEGGYQWHPGLIELDAFDHYCRAMGWPARLARRARALAEADNN